MRLLKPNVEKQLKQKRAEVDRQFVKQIAPVGGVKFHEQYLQKADGYECSLYIYDYPHSVQANWLSFLKQHLKSKKAVVYLSLEPISTEKSIKMINRATKEQRSRYRSQQASDDIREKAKQSEYDLKVMLHQIQHQGEQLFHYVIRVMLCAETLEQLEIEVREIKQKLKQQGLQGTILLNEQVNESRAPFRSLSKDYIYRRKGIVVPSLTLASTYPFSNSYLDDPRGAWIGHTMEGGQVMYDLYHKGGVRTSNSVAIFGKPGSGKSTLLKYLIRYYTITGNRTRSIDPVGETVNLARLYGGQVIDLDGSSDSVINPLEQTYHLKDGTPSLEATLSKAKTFLSIVAKGLTEHELALFTTVLKPLYEEKEQPLFEDVLARVMEHLSDETLSVSRKVQYENLQLRLEELVAVYGHLFNRPTTVQTLEEQMVVYTLRGLTDADQNIFQAQLYNVLSSLFKEVVIHGKSQKEAYDRGELSVDDVITYTVFLDEAHHVMNQHNLLCVRAIDIFQRESRKYFGGFVYATHLLSEMAHSSEKDLTPEQKELNKLLALTQYKFIMNQDVSDIDLYRKVFKKQLNEREVNHIPYLKKGEAFLCISGERNLHLQINKPTEAEQKIFGGGR